MRQIQLLVISAVVLLIAAILLGASLFVVTPMEQVIITQFGDPVGEPIQKEGLHFKVPFIQDVNSLDRRILEWDGDSTPMQTKDKRFIQVDTFARWQIADPLLFFQRLRDERSADSRLDDILAGETMKAIATNDLVEVVRTTKDRVPESGGDDIVASSKLEPIQTGRNKIEADILAQAAKELEPLGILLLDIRFKRTNYRDKLVIEGIWEKMSSERREIADEIRSEGEGEASRILGSMDRELKEIESGAYRKVQEIQGEADGKATEIYATAYNKSPEAVEFYQFIKTMEVYKDILGSDTTLVLSTNSDLFEFFKGVDPDNRRETNLNNSALLHPDQEELPLFLRDN